VEEYRFSHLLLRMLALLVISVLILSPAFTLPVYAQSGTIRFENISTEQGLSQSTVNSIIQDQLGYLWFATEGGLNIYDGYQFTVYHHDPNNPGSLSDNLVFSVYEDRDGAVWIGTSTGLDRYDRSSGNFIHYQKSLIGSDSLSDIPVSVIVQDQSGEIWVGTDGGGLKMLDLTTNRVTEYKHHPDDPQSLSSDSIDAIYISPDGKMWIGTEGGLDRFNRQTGAFVHELNTSLGVSNIENVPVNAIYEDHQGMMWIGTRSGLIQWDQTTNRIISFQHDPNDPDSISDDSIRTIYEDSQCMLWIGTLRGLNQLDETLHHFIHYVHNPNDPESLSSDYIRSIFKDRSGVLWVGTSGGGLNKYARSTQKFAIYKYQPGLQNSLSDNNVWSVYEDQNDNLWIGTFFSGLNKLDLNTGKVTIYQNDPSQPTSLSDNEIRAILQDRNGILWVGTEHGGLNRFDPDTETFLHYRHSPDDPTSLSSDRVFSIYEDHLGRLWIGTEQGGLNRFDQALGTFIHYQHDDNDPLSLSENDVRTINEDHTGTLWIGTFGGISLWDNRENHFKIYQHDPDNPSSLSNDYVACFFEDKSGAIWIGTFGGGLNRFDRNTQSFTHYTTQNGLPDDTIFGILADADGFLWLSTNKGLSKFDPEAGTFRNYDISDGLQGNQFNAGAYFQAQNGEMFFGGTKGLNVFFPSQVIDNPIPPLVVITAVLKYNQTIQTNLATNTNVQLSYRDNFISFEYAALDFNSPGKNQYAYQLVGVDKNWVYAGTRRYASYANLPGGSFTFQVKASNNDGVWSEQATTLHIHVTPPFWQTWWFFGIIGLIVVGGSISGYRFRVRGFEIRNRELARRVEQRTYELTTLNSISAMVNSSLDLTEILNSALKKMIEVMHMDAGLAFSVEDASAGIMDEPYIKLLAHQGVSEEHARLNQIVPLRSTLVSKAVEAGRPLIFYGSTHPNPQVQEYHTQYGIRMSISIPLLVKGNLVGTLTMAAREPREITANELSLLKAIGQQVAMAVVNARLYEQTEKRTHELATLNTIYKVVNRSLDLTEILNAALDKTIEVMRMDGGLAYCLEEADSRTSDGPLLRLIAHRGVSDEYIKIVKVLPLHATLIKETVKTGKPDVRLVNNHPNPRIRKAIEQAGVRLAINVPLLVQGKLIGALTLATWEMREITQEELSLLMAISQQIGMAVVNAQLYEKAEQTAIMTERSRLARELHDSVTQLLYSVTLYAEAAAELLSSGETETATGHLRDLRDTAQEALREMRLLIFELHRPTLEQGGLAGALQARLEAVEKRGEMQVQLQVEGNEQITRPVQVELYNIAYEALNNTLKHAHTDSVRVRLRFGEDATEMEICDYGKGFDPTAEGQGGGFGIPGMQERARKIGGTLQIESAPGKGTCVSVIVPVNPNMPTDQAVAGLQPKGMA
jgi:ligand-binding sensor domain-containing protein/signal transduction histidine kinase